MAVTTKPRARGIVAALVVLAIESAVENDVAPDSIVVFGTNFSSTLGTLTGLPTTRSRPLCAYPKTLRYTGPVGGDISLASNYSCQ